MTAQDLKNSILQLAVEGKLLRNFQRDFASQNSVKIETGAELLEQIKAEKAKLIAEGKIKKGTTKAGASGRALEPITEDEKPFDIPENWCWCRLGEIGTFVRGSGIRRTETVENGLPCVRYGEFYTTYKIKFSTIKSFVPKNIFDNSHHIIKNDICMALTGENKFDIALASVYEGDTLVAMGGDMTKFTSYFCYPLYLVYAINSPYGIECKRNLATGDIICHISNDKLASIPIPLPPLAEQKAIVAKIEELLPYIQKYDAAHTKLEEFNKKFPVEMQKSILQQAVMGKLTEDWRNKQASLAKTNSAGHLADCSNAKDLLEKIKAQKAKAGGKATSSSSASKTRQKELPPITEDEIPFDIPESWEFCRLGDIVNLYTGNSINETEKAKNYTDLKEGFNYIATKDVGFDKSIDYNNGIKIPFDKDNFRVAHKGYPLMCIEGGSAGRKIGILEEDVCFGNKLCVFESYLMDYSKFIYYYLQSPMFTDIFNSNMNGIIGGVSINKLKTLIIPLPPLAEQKVIVEKIEELLPLCKKLVK